jgi:hypothetical protein
VATITAAVEAGTAGACNGKVALVAPAGIVTADGIVTLAKLGPCARATVTELEAAAANFKVHVAEAGVTSDDGLQANPEM